MANEVAVLVSLVSLTVVAATVAGAYGLPKTLPNVALQQLIFATSEQQKAPLKLPESPQGTAAIVLKGATGIREPEVSQLDRIPPSFPTTGSIQ